MRAKTEVAALRWDVCFAPVRDIVGLSRHVSNVQPDVDIGMNLARNAPIAGKLKLHVCSTGSVWRKTQADLRDKSSFSQSFSATVGSS